MSSGPYFSGRPVAATSALEDAPVLPEPPLTAVKPKPQHRRRTGPLRNAVEWILIIGVALLVAVVIKQFLVQAFYIPSESMKSSLNVGDRVLVNKLSYHMHDVHRGDIVVFKRPPAESGEPAIKDLIKRVIGLPGDTIEERDGVVYINDHQLNEPYLAKGMVTTTNSSAVAIYGVKLNVAALSIWACRKDSITPIEATSAVSFCNPTKSFSSGGTTRRTA